MRLPAEALAELGQPHVRVHVGDIWWLPEELAGYPGGKGRFCLIVALETPAAKTPLRAHYVAGSTRAGGAPELVFEAGEANLRCRTHFRFWWSADIEISTLINAGRYVGRVELLRRPEIVAAVLASNRAVLKRLVS